MSKPEFVYTTYIETTAEQLWHALTDGDFTERYWFGHRITSDWKVGSAYGFTNQGKPMVEGKVLVSDPPRRLAYTWYNRKEEAKGEGTSRVTFDLEFVRFVESPRIFPPLDVSRPPRVACLTSPPRRSGRLRA